VAALLAALVYLSFLTHRYAPGTLFLTLAALSLFFSDRRTIRHGFIFVLFSGMVLASQVFEQRWPFESWALYRMPAPKQASFYVLEVGDSNDTFVRFDDRVLGMLTTPTNLSRLAGRLVALSGSPAFDETAGFLLRQANRYRQEVLDGRQAGVLQRLRFPPHQYGYAWTADLLRPMTDFSRVRVMAVSARFSDDGRVIESRTETVAAQYGGGPR
jgi:hypothetical protein